jgi:hypothetical protein
MRQIEKDMVSGLLGLFRVSTTQTISGGAPPTPGMFFSDADFVDETPWPYETMVFADKSSAGLYHAAYGTEEEARRGHLLMIETIRTGAEFGGGVEGPHGSPAQATIDLWKSRQKQTAIG